LDFLDFENEKEELQSFMMQREKGIASTVETRNHDRG